MDIDAAYLDEEDCLSTEVFANELELLVQGSVKLKGRCVLLCAAA
jgi:hypothetical protein